jgi:CDP-diacylglycerol--serine O-phosphatidyltransferase
MRDDDFLQNGMDPTDDELSGEELEELAEAEAADADAEEAEVAPAKPGRRRFGLKGRRARLPAIKPVAPNTVTMLALAFGISSIHMALWGRWKMSVLFLLVSSLCDFLDGKVARMLGVSSRFGAELDSLSDFVCFGLAPGFIMYNWSMDAEMRLMALSDLARRPEAVTLHWGFVLVLAVCCAGRLARFNAALDEEMPPYWKHFFTGVPAPAGGFLALSPLILSLGFPAAEHVFRSTAWVSVSVLAAAVLMASRLPTFSLKHLHLTPSLRMRLWPLLALFLACCFVWPWRTGAVVVMGYALSIPVSIVCFLRAKRHATAPQPQ